MKVNKFLVISVLIFYSGQNFTINPALLKGTHTILAAVDTYYSPFAGLVFVEKGIAEQWYRLSSKFLIQDARELVKAARNEDLDQDISKEKLDQCLSQYEDLINSQKDTSVQKLLEFLFVINPSGSFNLTNAANNPVRYLTAKHIGGILRLIWQFEKSKDVTEAAYAQLQNNLESLLADFAISSIAHKVFKAKEWRPFVVAIIKSLQECNGLNSKALYPSGTVQGILLGYMLERSETRQDLEEYFQEFLNDPTFILLPDEYTESDIEYWLKRYNHLTSVDDFANFICAVIYQTNYLSDLPKLAVQTNVDYQGVLFTDCVETMMLNLVNIISYNKNNRSFSKCPAGFKFSPLLQEFRNNKDNNSILRVKDSAVHQDFLNLVENKVGCVYNRLLVVATKKSIEIRKQHPNCDGVIPVFKSWIAGSVAKSIDIEDQKFQIYEKKVGAYNYWLIPVDSGLECFELMPTLSNIIVLLNNLFEMKLDSSAVDKMRKLWIAGDFVASQVLSPTFEITYFPRLMKALHWPCGEYAMLAIKSYITNPSESLVLPIVLSEDVQFNLELLFKAHGSIKVELKSTSYLIDFSFFQSLSYFNQALSVGVGIIDFSLLQNLTLKNLHQLILFMSTVTSDQKILWMGWLLQYKFFEHLCKSNLEYQYQILQRYFYLLSSSLLNNLDFSISEVLRNNLILNNILVRLYDQKQLPIFWKICVYFSDLQSQIFKADHGKMLYLAAMQDYDAVWDLVMQSEFDNEKKSFENRQILDFLGILITYDLQPAIRDINKITGLIDNQLHLKHAYLNVGISEFISVVLDVFGSELTAEKREHYQRQKEELDKQ